MPIRLVPAEGCTRVAPLGVAGTRILCRSVGGQGVTRRRGKRDPLRRLLLPSDGMPLTNPWLQGPAPVRQLPIDLLDERILNLLSTHNTAVVATVNPDGSPNATPVRFYSLGFEIFFTSWHASPKSRNLRRDSRVAAGIVAPLVGQASSRGAQLFGTATTLERGDPRADPYWEAFRWQSDHVERGRSLEEPPDDPLTVITPDRIVYTEHWLRRSGYAPRQIWTPEASREPRPDCGSRESQPPGGGSGILRKR